MYQNEYWPSGPFLPKIQCFISRRNNHSCQGLNLQGILTYLVFVNDSSLGRLQVNVYHVNGTFIKTFHTKGGGKNLRACRWKTHEKSINMLMQTC